jgi:MFS family permease
MELLLMDCSQIYDWSSTLQHRALLHQTSLLLPSMHGTFLLFLSPKTILTQHQVAWAGLTMVTAAAQKPQDIMAIRFFQALFESSTFVGTHYILGSWYTEKELGKRSGIFTASGLAGTMIGGFIQTGIHSSMDGLHGMSGWRWLFSKPKESPVYIQPQQRRLTRRPPQ